MAILWLLLVNTTGRGSVTTRAQPPRVVEEPGVRGYVLAPDGTPVSGGTVVSQSETFGRRHQSTVRAALVWSQRDRDSIKSC